MRITQFMLVSMFYLLGATAMAGETDLDAGILDIQHEWARINYKLPDDDKDAAFTALEERTAALADEYPQRAEPKAWQAIVLSTHAGARGGLGALSMVKDARDLLQAARKIDPNALDGSIYTSLGSLYYQVPGWPIGFGDDDKAESLLKQALQINPDGLDPNYFYGDFLYQEDRPQEALAVLKKALQAPPRPNRPLADEGRRNEVRMLIHKIENAS